MVSQSEESMAAGRIRAEEVGRGEDEEEEGIETARRRRFRAGQGSGITKRDEQQSNPLVPHRKERDLTSQQNSDGLTWYLNG